MKLALILLLLATPVFSQTPQPPAPADVIVHEANSANGGINVMLKPPINKAAVQKVPEDRNGEINSQTPAKADDQKLIDDAVSDQELQSKFHWRPAIAQSALFLGFQHGFRVLGQKKTRVQLGGPFFKDWGKSVSNLRGWKDGDPPFTNYVAHPLQGGLTGRIFVNNSDLARRQEFGGSKRYWESRMKAMAWSAFWSTQFELGPVSEATIGNVGMMTKKGHSTMAYVDLVITPVVGTGILVGEDAIDKYVLKRWLETKGLSTRKLKWLRTFLTPTTSVANMLRGRAPWVRDFREL